MDDRVALVTGASRGIGFATAQRLLARGLRVAITARDATGLAEAIARLGKPDRTLALTGRSDDPAHQREAVDTLAQRWGSVDVLVNNVGINPVAQPLLRTTPEAMRKTFEVNAISCVGWAAQMRRVATPGRSGCIVNVSSYATVRPSPGLGAYGASKAALTHLTRQLALELAPEVRVNAVIPAVIATTFASTLYEGRREAVEAQYPLGRLGEPDDVAAAVAFLVSEDASWITGECLLIDGGHSLTGGVV